MTSMLIVGPQGSGKGTQAKRVAEDLNIIAISTGDIFRSNIKNETELGIEAARYVNAGNLVPDEVTNKMVADRLAQPDVAEGFLLDGYPRNRAQVRRLDEILSAQGDELDLVVELTADTDELSRRLKKRAELEGRSDDADEATVRRRLELFEQETRPMIEEYAQRGILHQVDGLGEVDQVTERIMEALRG